MDIPGPPLHTLAWGALRDRALPPGPQPRGPAPAPPQTPARGLRGALWAARPTEPSLWGGAAGQSLLPGPRRLRAAAALSRRGPFAPGLQSHNLRNLLPGQGQATEVSVGSFL